MAALIERLGGAEATLRTLLVAALVALRVAPLAIALPPLALRGVPLAARVAVLLALTVALTPLALASAPPLPDDVLLLAAIAARELALGGAFAVACAVPLLALADAGRIVDAMRGAAAHGGRAPGPFTELHRLLGAVLFLVLGGHRLAIAALGEGLVALPPGAPLAAADLAGLGLGTARVAVAALALAISFAAPAALALLAVEVALGAAARAAPALPIQVAAVPLRAALGVAAVLLALAVLVPHLGPIFESAVAAAARLAGAR